MILEHGGHREAGRLEHQCQWEALVSSRLLGGSPPESGFSRSTEEPQDLHF